MGHGCRRPEYCVLYLGPALPWVALLGVQKRGRVHSLALGWTMEVLSCIHSCGGRENATPPSLPLPTRPSVVVHVPFLLRFPPGRPSNRCKLFPSAPPSFLGPVSPVDVSGRPSFILVPPHLPAHRPPSSRGPPWTPVLDRSSRSLWVRLTNGPSTSSSSIPRNQLAAGCRRTWRDNRIFIAKWRPWRPIWDWQEAALDPRGSTIAISGRRRTSKGRRRQTRCLATEEKRRIGSTRKIGRWIKTAPREGKTRVGT